MTWTPKDPGSVEHFAFDFAPMLADGDTIAVINGVTIDQGDSALVVGAPVLQDGLIVTLLSGGTDSVTYQLRAEVTTVIGERLELSATLLVRRRAQ